ncbi:uncharacterized protein A4U43_C01F14470 [Asparagus officinalis]|uniref:Uncharacterized protein n=1 Tax=Asparagus officinalis TaxID=4686 RepID=A0A5P1FQ55_ASPOF|nr:uncharacterized protein A4U43_C01F14470 [Asparagus officinalis]
MPWLTTLKKPSSSQALTSLDSEPGNERSITGTSEIFRGEICSKADDFVRATIMRTEQKQGILVERENRGGSEGIRVCEREPVVWEALSEREWVEGGRIYIEF